ncbi:MAG: hypothetical protein C0621_06905 [Desulfuromonas sp.]|nr:MAG: hypothetical protein C0621_06905 [Desulfuromonas sp.]
MLLPFSFAFAVAWNFPEQVGAPADIPHLTYALFIATALSISALPIIAKILMDLNLYRSDLGVTIVAAAVFNDLLGWMVFAVILGLSGLGGGHALPIGQTLTLTLGFTAAMLTVIPWLLHRLLPWIQAYASWPGGVLGFALSGALFSAAFSEWMGIHAIFGSFLFGVALGHSSHLREHTRTTIDQFVSFIFAPLFFASIGLHVNFATHFNLTLTLLLFALSFSGKVIGSALGGRLGGLSWRHAWGAGFGMSAQGTMGIILGVLALQLGLITQELFVSLVVVALLTSLASGPLLQQALRLKKKRLFTDFLDPTGFVGVRPGSHREETIRDLIEQIAPNTGLPSETIAQAVLARERLMATGIGNAVAVPHARLDPLRKPLLAIGLYPQGVDFDAPDGQPAQIICLILTPKDDSGAQLEILADIAATLRDELLREKLLVCDSYTAFLAQIRTFSKRSE